MTDQSEFRIPMSGDNWRHYKGDLYTIIGLGHDDEGHIEVIYTDADWTRVQLAPIYTQRLGRFLQEVENGKPRMTYQGPRFGRCQYLRDGAVADEVAF